jgi:hypothetical protein
MEGGEGEVGGDQGGHAPVGTEGRHPGPPHPPLQMVILGQVQMGDRGAPAEPPQEMEVRGLGQEVHGGGQIPLPCQPQDHHRTPKEGGHRGGQGPGQAILSHHQGGPGEGLQASAEAGPLGGREVAMVVDQDPGSGLEEMTELVIGPGTGHLSGIFSCDGDAGG